MIRVQSRPVRQLRRVLKFQARHATTDANENAKKYHETVLKVVEAAAVTFASVSILGLSGYAYHAYYQQRVLRKIRHAFNSDTAQSAMTDGDWIAREEQSVIDKAVNGTTRGRYYLLIGEKGTGKTSMLLEAVRRVGGLKCAMFEAHADPEIVRIRLGKAVEYNFHEDYIGSLFSIRGPRDTTALLDIERAFDKLEEFAAKEVQNSDGRPLVLIVNSTHLLREDEDGVNLVELLQQRAESFAASGLVTMIFNSDDYWVYERFKKLGTRLDVVTVRDLNRAQSVEALKIWRRKYFATDKLDDTLCNKLYDIVGGRPQFLNRVAQHSDMLAHARAVVENERIWLLNQCGLLGADMDDDVMETGKFSSSAMLLVKALVEMQTEHMQTNNGNPPEHFLPSLPLWRARQIMTRPDYIQRYDNLNIFTIDSHSNVRADSVPMMDAFRQIATEPGFNDLLNETLDRVSQIESLGRTRELVAKDLIKGRYRITRENKNELVVALESPDEDE
ncbi:hypothetical protein V1512DRAFT_261846 [Lipomyces arxii]|uniref:uncharacterized protein n=1 Tax=Lipomyces arxii TaxID=56418 RepID=UPI0034CFC8CE